MKNHQLCSSWLYVRSYHIMNDNNLCAKVRDIGLLGCTLGCTTLYVLGIFNDYLLTLIFDEQNLRDDISWHKHEILKTKIKS